MRGFGRGSDASGGRDQSREIARRATPRALLPLLDRLIDDDPGSAVDGPMSSYEAMEQLRRSVRRDLEVLLNARRRWQSWPANLHELAGSPVGFGLPDLSSGALTDPKRREAFRAEVEATIRRFEPRLLRVSVSFTGNSTPLDATLRMRIDGLLHADPAPEPIAFDTTVEPGQSEVMVKAASDV